MDRKFSEAPLSVLVKQDLDVEGICKKTYDVERIITKLRDANWHLTSVLASMKKSGLHHFFNEDIERIQLKIEESVVQLSTLNNVELDLKAFDRQICEKMNHKYYKEFEEYQLKSAEKLERDVFLAMEKRFEELHVKYLKQVCQLESGGLKSHILVELPLVPGLSGDHSAGSEEQDVLKDESGEESSVPSAESTVVGDGKEAS